MKYQQEQPYRTNYMDIPRVTYKCTGEIKTKQDFKDDVVMSSIMKKYRETGIIAHQSLVQGRYGDYVDAPEYDEAMNKIVAANDMFESLPADIRDRFNNSPEKFLEFVHDPDNEDEMRKLGLLNKKDSPEESTAKSSKGGEAVKVESRADLDSEGAKPPEKASG